MNYDLVATLGPSSQDEPVWKALIEAGATAFRLNTSHLTLAQLDAWLFKLGPFLRAMEPTPPLVLDLQGSKWRLGQFAPFELAPGQTIDLVYAPTTKSAGVLPVPHLDFFQAAPLSSRDLVLNDARIRLAVESVQAEQAIRARVMVGGAISPRKGITYAASEYRKESLGEQDHAIVERTRGLPFVRYAISYVRDAAEMARYRAHLGKAAYLIAKLERRPAVDQVPEVAQAADEIWLCRGDLGAELGTGEMAEAVHQFSDEVSRLAVPAFLAGQVLEHMTGQPVPTRSEVCYLYDALLKGYRGVVLSDETAIGQYPVESCRTAALFR